MDYITLQAGGGEIGTPADFCSSVCRFMIFVFGLVWGFERDWAHFWTASLLGIVFPTQNGVSPDVLFSQRLTVVTVTLMLYVGADVAVVRSPTFPWAAARPSSGWHGKHQVLLYFQLSEIMFGWGTQQFSVSNTLIWCNTMKVLPAGQMHARGHAQWRPVC